MIGLEGVKSAVLEQQRKLLLMAIFSLAINACFGVIIAVLLDTTGKNQLRIDQLEVQVINNRSEVLDILIWEQCMSQPDGICTPEENAAH